MYLILLRKLFMLIFAIMITPFLWGEGQKDNREVAPEIITLDIALELALKRNPSLVALSWELKAAEARVLQTGLLPNPELGIEVENIGGSESFQNLDAAETTIEMSQLIELGAKRAKRKRVVLLEYDLLERDYESKRLDLITQIKKGFIDVLAAQEHLRVKEQVVHLAEQVFLTVSERVKAGKDSPMEMTKAKVELSTSRIVLRHAHRDLEIARKRLAATWGSTLPMFKKAHGVLENMLSIPSYEQLEYLILQNPDVSRWTEEIELRQVALKKEKASSIPDMTIGGGVRYFNETDENTYVIGVSFPLPLFDRNQGGILEAKYNLTKVEEERRSAIIEIKTALAEAYQELSTAHAEATAWTNEVIPGAQNAFDAAHEGYRQGKFNYLEVLDAQRTFFESIIQYTDTLAAYHRAASEIERLTGGSLKVKGNIKETGNGGNKVNEN